MDPQSLDFPLLLRFRWAGQTTWRDQLGAGRAWVRSLVDIARRLCLLGTSRAYILPACIVNE